MQAARVDLTTFFRALGRAARGDAEPARGLVLDLAAFDAWLERWRALGPDGDAMDRVNPVYIPRNHLVEAALAAATGGDLGPLEQLLGVVRSPYDERPGLEAYAAPAPADFGAGVPDLLRDLSGGSGRVGLRRRLEVHQGLLDAPAGAASGSP